MPLRIEAYRAGQKAAIIDLSLRAWAAVFTGLRPVVQNYVYNNFFPDGWADRQASDVSQVLDEEGNAVWVALEDDQVVGWMGLRFHDRDSMGEVRIIAVDPDWHRQGIGTALLAFADDRFRAVGLKMVMVETGDDPGHAPARAAYEKAGFVRWPVARYFREI